MSRPPRQEQRFHQRRLTLPSSGLAPAAQAWPSFHSGPILRRHREPLMSNVRRRKREELNQVQGIAHASLQPERVTPICTTCSLLTSELLAGKSVAHRTTTPVGSAIFATAISEGVSLVVAARPSAGRSPVRQHHVSWGMPSRCRAGLGSSTRTAGNTTPLRLAESVRYWA